MIHSESHSTRIVESPPYFRDSEGYTQCDKQVFAKKPEEPGCVCHQDAGWLPGRLQGLVMSAEISLPSTTFKADCWIYYSSETENTHPSPSHFFSVQPPGWASQSPAIPFTASPVQPDTGMQSWRCQDIIWGHWSAFGVSLRYERQRNLSREYVSAQRSQVISWKVS